MQHTDCMHLRPLSLGSRQHANVFYARDALSHSLLFEVLDAYDKLSCLS